MRGTNASPIGRSQEEKSLARNCACERPPRLRLLRWLRSIFLMAQAPLLCNLCKEGTALNKRITRTNKLFC